MPQAQSGPHSKRTEGFAVGFPVQMRASRQSAKRPDCIENSVVSCPANNPSWVTSIEKGGFAEYYYPLTGAACGGLEFTWTAAMVIEFVSQSEIA